MNRYALTATVGSFLPDTSYSVMRLLECWLLYGRRQISNQSQRNRQLFQLEVRTQKRHRTVTAGLPWNLRNINARFPQRCSRFGLVGRGVIGNDVTSDPAVEKYLRFGARHEASNLVPHHRLQVVRESGNCHQVGQLRGEARI